MPERRLARLTHAMLGRREAGETEHLQGNWKVGLWREGLGGEAGEIMATMATTE